MHLRQINFINWLSTTTTTMAAAAAAATRRTVRQHEKRQLAGGTARSKDHLGGTRRWWAYVEKSSVHRSLVANAVR
jgi:hypothetical protein